MQRNIRREHKAGIDVDGLGVVRIVGVNGDVGTKSTRTIKRLIQASLKAAADVDSTRSNIKRVVDGAVTIKPHAVIAANRDIRRVGDVDVRGIDLQGLRPTAVIEIDGLIQGHYSCKRDRIAANHQALSKHARVDSDISIRRDRHVA